MLCGVFKRLLLSECLPRSFNSCLISSICNLSESFSPVLLSKEHILLFLLVTHGLFLCLQFARNNVTANSVYIVRGL